VARSKADPRKVALLVVLTGVLAAVLVLRVKPALQGSVARAGSAAPRMGDYVVPELSWGQSTERVLPTPSSSRNLFTYGPPPTPTPDTRPTPTPPPTLPPRPRPTPPPAGIDVGNGRRLPPPPRFTLAYLGWLGPDRLRIAVFRSGEDVLAVPEGDTVKSSFIVRRVGPADVTIGYVGYPDTVSTKVPVSR
jgi:hypothetical protein